MVLLAMFSQVTIANLFSIITRFMLIHFGTS